MLMENLPIVWVVIAVILIGVEMFTGTFYLLVLAIAAAAAALAAWIGSPLALQLGISIVMALVGAVIVWRWHKKEKAKSPKNSNNMEIGQIVVWQGTAKDGFWLVRYRGTDWQATPISPDVNPQQPLVIAEMRGNILLLKNL